MTEKHHGGHSHITPIHSVATSLMESGELLKEPKEKHNVAFKFISKW